MKTLHRQILIAAALACALAFAANSAAHAQTTTDTRTGDRKSQVGSALLIVTTLIEAPA